MARLHLKFRNIRPTVRTATTTLFDAKPWREDDEVKHVLFNAWLRSVSESYGVPAPTLEVIEDEGVGHSAVVYEWGRISLGGWSIISLMHGFRHHLQAMGSTSSEMGDCTDAQSWACSLFYLVRPVMFRKRVREGRIAGVKPWDLLSSETIASMEQEMALVDAEIESRVHGEIEQEVRTSHPENIAPETDEEETQSNPNVLNTTQVMALSGRSRSYVCEHAQDMGGRRGPRGQWLFDSDQVRAFLAQERAEQD